MKNRNYPIYMIAIALLMIFSGCVSSFIISLKADKKNVLNRMEDVSNTFEEFSTGVSIFEEQRDLLYTQVLSSLYYDSMFIEDAEVKNKLSNYESIVTEIDKKKNSLDKLCQDIYYPDSKVNNKCINYKSIYEQVVNYFVTDINYYNKNVNDYNIYAKNLNSNNLISKYKTTKKYIDYNDDGKFDGKEE